MGEDSAGTITLLLEAVGAGDAPAREKLWSAVYDELREMAAALMAHEAAGHLLQPTALVHEAYARLFGGEKFAGRHRAYFFGAAALAMRRILIEDARKRAGQRAQAEATANHSSDSQCDGFSKNTQADRSVSMKTRLEDFAAASTGLTIDRLLALDEALDTLAIEKNDVFDVIMLRFFAGLTIEQTANTLEISARTVKRYWSFGRTWLFRRMSEDGC